MSNSLDLTRPDAKGRLEVDEGSDATRSVSITHSPFRIGRGARDWNHLALSAVHVSRKSAEIISETGQFHLRDLGQRGGVFVNGVKVEDSVSIDDGDVITFAKGDSLHIVFRRSQSESSFGALLSRLNDTTTLTTGNRDLRQLNLLLQATTLLHAHLPVDEVLASMLDHAISVTEADRGMLFKIGTARELLPALARRRKGRKLPLGDLVSSQHVIDTALRTRAAVVVQDVLQADEDVKQAQSIVGQHLRSVIAIPLYARSVGDSDASVFEAPDSLIGLLYMDSRRPTAFTDLARQVLDALAMEAASVIDNARMVEQERQRRRIEQELDTAREIQQRLLPKEFREYSFLDVSGSNESCYAVGGDYFDLLELGEERVLCVVADVSGKGLPAALLTATLQGGLAGTAAASEPTHLLNHINKYIFARTEPSRYATAFMVILDSNGDMSFVNAGHHSALLLHAGTVTAPFESDSFPIGMFDHTDYIARPFKLVPDDTLIVFSDGVNEAENNRGEEFGMERLLQVAHANSGAPVDALRSAIVADVLKFCEGAPQNDDMTVLVVRYRS